MPSHMSSPQTPSPKKGGGKKALVAVPVTLAVVLGGAYFGGVYAFGQYFMPGTTLEGRDVSLKPLSEVAAEKDASYDGFETHVSGNGIDLTISASDVDLRCDGEAYAQSAISSVDPWAWPLEITRSHELTANESISFDRDKLVALIQPLIEQSAQAADATGASGITYNADQGAFVMSDDVVTQHLNLDAVVDRIASAFSARETEVTIGDECLDASDSLDAVLDAANAYLAATPELTLSGEKAYDLTKDMVASWVVIGEDLTVGLDEQAIADWCHGELSEKLDTVGTKRTYTRPDGKKFTVYDDRSNYNSDPYGSSVYGWSIDGEKTAQEIISCLKGGQPSTIEIPCLSTAASINPGGQDWPDRYIDVDIDAQHATFFDGGEVIWEADITTGQPSKHNDTPTGVWVVGANGGVMQEGDVNLRGPLDSSGNPEWDSHVNFWIPVVRNLVGFHNCPWQYEFGGDIYTYYGSNGCIRMSYESAEKLYDIVEMGDAVVIHKEP
ncbi:L,D-transpeptidase [Thermophilibacter provencensis]|uniref:L,D-transpeptidase family protein n=1 Tax=Thermophilibacter provencensis TaxID=1852386 RepID=A0ABT7V350_9ACTN|nr:L,D-transpeptidase family protein [Thermophilibacter provencensis]MDM8270426.1 L,D-transpeptidase family protein [Thermophilibacter provencensis]